MDKKIVTEVESIVRKLGVDARPEISEPAGNTPGQISFAYPEPLEKIIEVARKIQELLEQNGYVVGNPKFVSKKVTMVTPGQSHNNLECTMLYSKLK